MSIIEDDPLDIRPSPRIQRRKVRTAAPVKPRKTQTNKALIEGTKEWWGARVKRNIAWIERHCHIPDGKFVGRRVKLTDKQIKWMHLIYGSPTRTFILSMGRKNAKTAFAAFLLLLHICGPEHRINSQIYSAAQSKDQAALIYNLAAKIVRMSPTLSGALILRESAKEIDCPELGTAYKALSADVSTSFGKSPVMVIHDELGQVKGPRSALYAALETAFAAHDSPLSLIISTQAPTDGDLLSVLIDDALTGADPQIKCVLFTADMDLDFFSEKAIRQANPHFDDFMNKTEVFRQATNAQRMPTEEAGFRNLILNQRVEARSPFVARSVWESNGDIPVSHEGKRTLFGGLDLSSVSDLTALVTVENVDMKWNVEPTFWLPADGLEDKSKNDRVPYDLWAKQGWLATTPGKSIEYEFVAAFLRKLFNENNVVAIAFDRYNMRFLKPWLVKAGFTEEELLRFVEFGQGFVSMSPALRELESLLLAAKLRHGKHPVLNMCAQNAVVVKDPAENRKFVKAKATGRIDGMVALAMAIGVMNNRAEIVKEPTILFL